MDIKQIEQLVKDANSNTVRLISYEKLGNGIKQILNIVEFNKIEDIIHHGAFTKKGTFKSHIKKPVKEMISDKRFHELTLEEVRPYTY